MGGGAGGLPRVAIRLLKDKKHKAGNSWKWSLPGIQGGICLSDDDATLFGMRHEYVGQYTSNFNWSTKLAFLLSSNSLVKKLRIYQASRSASRSGAATQRWGAGGLCAVVAQPWLCLSFIEKQWLHYV